MAYSAVEDRAGAYPASVYQYAGSLKDDIKSAIDDLRDLWDDCDEDMGPDNRELEVEDQIHELTDGAVPIYNSDIWQYAGDNFNEVVLGELDDPGLAGNTTEPLKILQIRLYEIIQNCLYDELREIVTAAEEWELDQEVV